LTYLLLTDTLILVAERIDSILP